MLRITLRELEVFAAISRSGQITAAGEALGLSQSATSGAVAELERRLGVTLFDRIGRRVVLNEHGRYLLPQALDLLQQALGGNAETHFDQVAQQASPDQLSAGLAATMRSTRRRIRSRRKSASCRLVSCVVLLPRRNRLRTRASSSEKANGLTR